MDNSSVATEGLRAYDAVARGVKRFARIAGIDTAIAFTVIGRGIQMGCGLVTIALVGVFLSPVEQGFYFAFGSVLALQIFFELGLTTVVLQFASHEKAFLSWTQEGTLTGAEHAKERLASLAWLTRRWYTVLAALAFCTIAVGGWWYFSTHTSLTTAVHWQVPWFWMVMASSANLLISPFVAIVEGCGRVISVAKLRIAQGVVANVVFWIAITTGFGLLSAAVLPTVIFFTSATWLFASHRAFLFDLLRKKPGKIRFDWKREVWPLQWRIALSWMSGYFISQLMVPVIFAVHGPAAAGQFGMSMTVATAITTLAIAWQNTKLPAAGALIAKREFEALNRLFFPALKQSTALVICCAFAVWCVDVLFYRMDLAFSSRLLPPLAFTLILLTAVINHVVYCEALYLRAHLKEPFLGLSMLNAALCTLVIVFGTPFGFVPLAGAYCLVNFGVGLCGGTFVFFRKRREWHCVTADEAASVEGIRGSLEETS